MIPLNDPVLYEDSLRRLRDFVGLRYQGRLAQIFLAAKHAGGGMPVVGSGVGLGTGDLQAALDDLYAKRSRLAANQPSIVSLFSDEHLYPTGVMAGHLTGPSNIWRNNFQLQKAMICYASEAELLNPAFVMAPRSVCPHLIPPAGALPGTVANAQCDLKMGTRYRGEDRAKFMRRHSGSGVISVVDPNNVQLWQNAVVPAAGRLPVAPLICAIYHDSDVAAGRTAVEPQDFCLDFNLSPAHYHALFDDDPTLPVHAALIAAFPALSWTQVAVAPPPAPAHIQAPPAPIAAAPAQARQRRVQRRVPLNDLPLVAPTVAPPAGGHWWAAEQAVQGVFLADGWLVIDRSRQGVGFDFEAGRAGERLCVEVKSSTGACSPVLTEREHEAAHEHGARYVMAIVENYDPGSPVRILWVRNPAQIPMAPRHVREYPLPRSRWLPRADAELIL